MVAAPLLLALTASGAALEWPVIEGPAHAYPVVRSLDGGKIADGDFSQWIDGTRLHVRIQSTFADGRLIEERGAFQQRPELIQDEWSWRETKGETLLREFALNLRDGTASAKKLDDDGALSEWSEEVELEPGRAFAGFGFTFALKALRNRLLRGERVELETVGFTPQPREVTVEVSYAGLDEMRMSDRMVRGDRFVLRPKIPWIARLFVRVPDSTIWLTSPAPAGFLRWEGFLAEPGDQIVRVDLLPGGSSGPATPVRAADR